MSYPQPWARRYEGVDRAQRAEQSFRPGQLVRFNPPAGAYSRVSEQHRQAGNPCQVVSSWNDSTVTVMFGDGNTIAVDSSYLYLEIPR